MVQEVPYLRLNTVKYAFETEVELVRSKMADRKSLSIYNSDGSSSSSPVRYELAPLPLEKHVRGVRQWLCMVERNGKASFERIYRSTGSQYSSKLQDVLELRKRRVVWYGAITVSALLGLTVARLRRRGVVGSLVYTSVSGGLVWGSLYLSDPVRREALRRSFKERQGMSFAEVKDHTLTAVKNRTVSATNATVAAVKAKYNEIRTRISEASKKGPEK